MAARAAYMLIDYIETLINPVVAPDSISFHPGNWAPTGTDNTFATYKYVANRDFTQPYLHLDNLTVKLHHTNYMTMKSMIDAIYRKLSLENIYDNPALMAAGMSEGIKLHDVVVRTAATDQNSFVDSTEYFYDTLDILFQYVEVPEDGNLSAFIEGV